VLGGLKGNKGGQHNFTVVLLSRRIFSVRSYFPNGSGEQSTYCPSQDRISMGQAEDFCKATGSVVKLVKH
jgi:hypothetical protein